MVSKRAFMVALAAFLALAAAPAWSAGSAPGVHPETGSAVAHDVSQPLSQVHVPAQLPPGFQVEVPLRAAPPRTRPNVSQGPDPARQSDAEPVFGAAATPAPLVNVPGLSDDDNAATIGGRVVPPDTEGDIGPDHYVQWINLIIGVWDVNRDPSGAPTSVTLAAGFPKAGNAVFAGFTGSAAADACRTTNNGDPIVLYDHLANRWLISQFAINSGVQCVAISQTGDPTGAYDRWAFVVSPGEQNDYPKLGVMPDAYYLSLRDFPSNDGTFAGFVALDRAAMLAGNPSPVFVKFSLPCLSGNCPDGVQPPHLEGPAPAAGTPGIFSRAWDDDFDGPLTGGDGYRLWAFQPNFASPGSSTFTELPFVSSASGWDSTVCGFFQRGCIPQPAGGERLDPADELQMYRAQYRHFTGHDSLLINTTVDSDGANTAGVRWVELRNSGSGWGLFQEGTYAPADGENRWMGSAAMNGSGDIALGYSVSSSGTFPSVRYTSRVATDPLGVLPGGEVVLVAGTGAQTASSNRWGDYSAMSVDPVDDCTFWYTQEYYENTNSFDFKTRIGAIPGPSCGGGGGCTPTEPTELTCNDGQDNDCDGFFDCADTDCAGDPVCGGGCTPTEPTEITCDDGLDNDCDLFIDCADADCAADPFCAPACLPKGDSCTSDAECCSGKCRGKASSKACK
jgi:hypothetical protein